MKVVQFYFISITLACQACVNRGKGNIRGKSLIRYLVGLLFALTLAACGGDESSNDAIATEEDVIVTSPSIEDVALAASLSYATYTGNELQFRLSTESSGVEFKVTKQPASGVLTESVVGNPLLLTYTPNVEFIGDDQVLFLATAADGNSATGVIDITVLKSAVAVVDEDVNSASVAALKSGSYATYATVPITLGLAANIEGIRFAITESPVNGVLTGSLNGNPLTLSYTPNVGFLGDESIGFSVTDSNGDTAVGALTIAVIENPFTVEEEQFSSADVAVAATGVYSTFSAISVHLGLSSGVDGMRFEIPNQPQNGVLTGSLTGNPLSLTYISNAAFVGEEVIGFRVIDSDGVSAIGMLTITVVEDSNNTEQAADITAVASTQSKSYSTFTETGVDINLLASDERIILAVPFSARKWRVNRLTFR